jgi:hypothetical protein
LKVKANGFIEDHDLKESFKIEIEKAQKRRKELEVVLARNNISSNSIKDLSQGFEFSDTKKPETFGDI